MMMAKQRRMEEQKQKMMMLGQLNNRKNLHANTTVESISSTVDMVRVRISEI